MAPPRQTRYLGCARLAPLALSGQRNADAKKGNNNNSNNNIAIPSQHYNHQYHHHYSMALIDLDITPRAAAPPSEPSFSSDTSASAADVISRALSQLRCFDASNPQKREIALFRACDHAMSRIDIFTSSKDLLREVLEHARCLTELGNGDRSAIVSLFEVPISSHHDFYQRLGSRWTGIVDGR